VHPGDNNNTSQIKLCAQEPWRPHPVRRGRGGPVSCEGKAAMSMYANEESGLVVIDRAQDDQKRMLKKLQGFNMSCANECTTPLPRRGALLNGCQGQPELLCLPETARSCWLYYQRGAMALGSSRSRLRQRAFMELGEVTTPPTSLLCLPPSIRYCIHASHVSDAQNPRERSYAGAAAVVLRFGVNPTTKALGELDDGPYINHLYPPQAW